MLLCVIFPGVCAVLTSPATLNGPGVAITVLLLPPKPNAGLSGDGVGPVGFPSMLPTSPPSMRLPVPPTLVARLPWPNATTKLGRLALATPPILVATLPMPAVFVPAPPPAETTLKAGDVGSLAMLNAALPTSVPAGLETPAEAA